MSIRYSVVVPVYNNPDDLRACLASLAALDFDRDRMEVIVVDNNSTDATPQVAAASGARVIFEREHQSSYAARNRGIEAALGEFVAFTDSDCVVAPDWLSRIEAATVQHAEAGCFAGEILPFPPTTLVERFSEEIGLLRQRGPLSGWHFKPYAQTANAVYRKAVFEKVGLFDPTIRSGGDALIAWRMLDETDWTLCSVPEAVVYHHHRTSVSELWKQFHRYGDGKMTWALARPDYTPPDIAKMEAEAVSAFEAAFAHLETLGLDERKALYPLLRSFTQFAHLSGYVQDVASRLALGAPREQLPARARTISPGCPLCGARGFLPEPERACRACGASSTMRALSRLFAAVGPAALAGRRALIVGDELPTALRGGLADVRSIAAASLIAAPETTGSAELVIAPAFSALAEGRDLETVLAALVRPLGPEGMLVLLDRADAAVKTRLEHEAVPLPIGPAREAILSRLLPHAALRSASIPDPAGGPDALAVIATGRVDEAARVAHALARG